MYYYRHKELEACGNRLLPDARGVKKGGKIDKRERSIQKFD